MKLVAAIGDRVDGNSSAVADSPAGQHCLEAEPTRLLANVGAPWGACHQEESGLCTEVVKMGSEDGGTFFP